MPQPRHPINPGPRPSPITIGAPEVQYAETAVPAAGPVPTTGTTSLQALTFYVTPAASQSSTALLRPGSAAALSLVAPYRGSIVAITHSASANKTAGTCTFTPRLGAGTTSLTKIKEGHAWNNGTANGSTAFSPGTHGFNKGDVLDIVYDTDAAYTSSGAAVEVTIWVYVDQNDA